MPSPKRIEPDIWRQLEILDINPTRVISVALLKDISPNVLGRVIIDGLNSGLQFREPEKWAAFYLRMKKDDPRMLSRTQIETAQMRGQWSGAVLYGLNRAGEQVPLMEANSATWVYRKRKRKGKREKGWVRFGKIKSRAGHFVVSLHPKTRRVAINFYGGVHHDGITLDFNQLVYAMRKARGGKGVTGSQRRR